MNQPHGTYTEADLERIIARDFPPEAAGKLKELLSRYGQESWQREVLRVQMACLKCANGDFLELERAVGAACLDYRDVSHRQSIRRTTMRAPRKPGRRPSRGTGTSCKPG